MSVQATSWVWGLDLPPAGKIVALALADHADPRGRNAWPSRARIAEMTGYSERQVQRIVGELVRSGVIRQERAATRTQPAAWRLTVDTPLAIDRAQWTTAGATPDLRREVIEVFGQVCAHCGRAGDDDQGPDGSPWEVHRVQAAAEGGQHRRDNVVLSCRSCHRRRGEMAGASRPGLGRHHVSPVGETSAARLRRHLRQVGETSMSTEPSTNQEQNHHQGGGDEIPTNDNDEKHADSTTGEALGLLVALPAPWSLGAASLRTLTPAVAAALGAGWSPADLAEAMTRNPPPEVRNPGALLGARLADLPPPPGPAADEHPPWCQDPECDQGSRWRPATRPDGTDYVYPCPLCHRDSVRASARAS